MFSIWVHTLVAFVIAVTAFVIGQFAPGMGVPFVLLATTAWAALATARRRKTAQGG